MARKKRQQTQAPPPLIEGEVWEVGRRALDVHVAELERRGERPEFLLAVQTGDAGGVVLADAISSSTPPTALADFVLQAMRQPLLGQPRRPAVIRVGSQAEAEILAVSLATTGIALEVSARLEVLDYFHSQLGRTLGGLTSDYRTQAAQAGETLSEAGLRAFFQTARQFYREEMWLSYGDEMVFEIALQPAQGPDKTLYGILMGNMGEEFGLALYYSLDDLQRFYDLSVQHLDHFTSASPQSDAKQADPAQLQREAEATAQFLQVPSVSLTYTPQREVPPPLVQEAQRLKLPLASKAAFPLVMRTGQGGMQIATATDLGDMFSAMRAILDWDGRIDDTDGEDEVDIAITSQLPAVEGLLPALTAHTTLRDNPCLPEEEMEDEADDDDFPAEFEDLFEVLLSDSSDRSSPSPGQKSAKASSSQQSKATGGQAAAPTTRSSRVYTLDVYLVDGPITEAYANREIVRRIDILGHQTLHDLHEAIFEAFERWEEHLYEFNLGEGPADRSQLYFYRGGWDANDAEEAGGDPEATTLDALQLNVGRRFGYTFDLGDQWEHIIEVVATKEGPGKGSYPRVVQEVGPAPPQYPEDDDDEE